MTQVLGVASLLPGPLSSGLSIAALVTAGALGGKPFAISDIGHDRRAQIEAASGYAAQDPLLGKLADRPRCHAKHGCELVGGNFAGDAHLSAFS